MALNQSGLLTTLAYLMGERSVNATTSAPRADFLQKTLEEVYQAYPWRFAQATATITIVSGIATLPTNLDISHHLRATYFTGTTEIDLTEVDPVDKFRLNNGNNGFWLTPQSDGTFLLNTKDTTPTAVVVKYQQLPPTLDSAGNITTPFSSGMTLALGARRFVKLGQNPDADISQDQKAFENHLSNDIAAHQVPSPRKMRRSRQNQIGSHTGEF